MKRSIMMTILNIQYIFGFVFCLLGMCFGVLVFKKFRATGVPIAGFDQTLSAFGCAITISAIAIAFGLAASFVAKHQLRKQGSNEVNEHKLRR